MKKAEIKSLIKLDECTTNIKGEEKYDDTIQDQCDKDIKEDGKSVVKVLGMEMTESCEGGAKWSRTSTPLSRPQTPQNIFLPGSLPTKSQLLVSDSHTETIPDQNNSVVLQGKVTLSLIGFPEQGLEENGIINHYPGSNQDEILEDEVESDVGGQEEKELVKDGEEIIEKLDVANSNPEQE